ncbi:MAG: ImmA/IrrE family metallo-endopeptidase [Pseudonocardiaceae bacterium]
MSVFIPEARIKAETSELWQRHKLEPGFDVEQLLDALDLGLCWEPVSDDPTTIVLGQLIPAERTVVINERHRAKLEAKGGRLLRYTLGHEIGHWHLHADDIRSGTISLFDGRRVWCRDGSTDPVERQAEMFAAALLMPHGPLQAQLPKAPWNGWPPVYRLADDFAVNVTPMTIRLERLGWMHRDAHGRPVSGPKPDLGQGALFS